MPQVKPALEITPHGPPGVFMCSNFMTQGDLCKWGSWLQLTLQGQAHPSSCLYMDGAFMVKHPSQLRKYIRQAEQSMRKHSRSCWYLGNTSLPAGSLWSAHDCEEQGWAPY